MKNNYKSIEYCRMISRKTKLGMSRKNVRRKVLRHIFKLAKDTKMHVRAEKSKVRHHKDLNRANNKRSNILILPNMSKHRQLHARAYDYLVKIGKIRGYLQWFKKRYL